MSHEGLQLQTQQRNGLQTLRLDTASQPEAPPIVGGKDGAQSVASKLFPKPPEVVVGGTQEFPGLSLTPLRFGTPNPDSPWGGKVVIGGKRPDGKPSVAVFLDADAPVNLGSASSDVPEAIGQQATIANQQPESPAPPAHSEPVTDANVATLTKNGIRGRTGNVVKAAAAVALAGAAVAACSVGHSEPNPSPTFSLSSICSPADTPHALTSEPDGS